MPTKLLPNATCIFIAMTICFLIAGCASTLPEKFPDTEIVYETGVPNTSKIGFINADGSSNLVLATDIYVARPIWSADGQTLYVLQWNGPGGDLSIWREGRTRHICENYPAVDTIGGVISEAGSTKAVIDNAGKQITLIDLERCSEIKKYVNFAMDQEKGVRGVSLSSDKTRIVYAEISERRSPSPKYSIKIMILGKGETLEIGEGINPTWSPDDKWIAYTKLDGIYVMASDGSQSHRLVEYDAASEPFKHEFAVHPPSPRWSPDGKWLIYHRCASICQYLTDSSIFKVEIATGTEAKIVDGGAYPFWRSR